MLRHQTRLEVPFQMWLLSNYTLVKSTDLSLITQTFGMIQPQSDNRAICRRCSRWQAAAGTDETVPAKLAFVNVSAIKKLLVQVLHLLVGDWVQPARVCLQICRVVNVRRSC